MNKTLSYVLYVLLAIVSLALLVMTVLASAGIASVWVGMPIIVVLFIFAIALVISVVAFNPNKRWYSVGFYVLHIGIVLFLLGSFIYTVSGVKTNVQPPVADSITPTIEFQMKQRFGYTDEEIAKAKGFYNQIPYTNEEGDPAYLDLGFNFRVASFRTEYYDKEQTSVKHYEATLEFWENGKEETELLTVNHPVRRGGWKIYLMNVGVNELYGYTEVQLLFKKDPTEFMSTSGIVLTVLGTFMMCFLRPRDAMLQKKKENAKKKKGGSRQ